VENKSNFYNALLKTKYGKALKKKLKNKAKKVPLTLKAIGLAGMAAHKIKKGDIEYKKKIGKNSNIKIKANPKKKNIGLWFTKSF